MDFKVTFTVVGLAMFTLSVMGASYLYSACGSNGYLNTANIQCKSCPTNQIANTYEAIATVCQCAVGYTPSGNGACTSISSNICGSSNNNFYPIYLLNGDNSGNGGTCTTCAANAYPNR
jgi:hypothetical protein